VISLTTLLIAGFLGLAASFYGLVAVLVIHLSFLIYTAADAAVKARRQPNYVLQYYNTGLYYLLYAAIILGTNWCFDSSTRLGIQTFHIPSPSNCPTLQVHDRVVADLNSYKKGSIDYGDIVIFNYQPEKEKEPTIYTFRIVGLPHDKLEIRDNIVVINGKESPSRFIKDTLSDEYPVQEFTEVLPNGHQHKLYKFKEPYDSTIANMKDIVVPSDCYYVMGDNRDNALDSRYIGFVKKQDILGQMIYTYWGKTKDRININLRDK